jgi:hypothetical protein
MTFAHDGSNQRECSGQRDRHAGFAGTAQTALAAVLTYWLVSAAETAPIHPTATNETVKGF